MGLIVQIFALSTEKRLSANPLPNHRRSPANPFQTNHLHPANASPPPLNAHKENLSKTISFVQKNILAIHPKNALARPAHRPLLRLSEVAVFFLTVHTYHSLTMAERLTL
jgi:hypothetical protein